jgi:hypothetical protein
VPSFVDEAAAVTAAALTGLVTVGAALALALPALCGALALAAHVVAVPADRQVVHRRPPIRSAWAMAPATSRLLWSSRLVSRLASG